MRRKGIMKMENGKLKRLERKGWKVTTPKDLLGMTDDEERTVELKLLLSRALREKRREANLTQERFASLLRSSQSRLAKMEAGDPTVSFDLLIRSLFKAGVDRKKLSKIIAS